MRYYSALLTMLFVAVGMICSAAAKAEQAASDAREVPPKPSDKQSSAGEWLRAGPIRVKLEDGQLRYLYVGDKEIVRRIYFGVRDGNWGTALPTFTKMDVEKSEDHFTVSMAANCKMDAVDISWTGVIIGSADGKITFQATGTPNADFQSNRIGLCVLFGVHSLAKQAFQTDGPIANTVFPVLVSPKLVGEQFHTLQYTTANGLHVSCSLEGAIFDMEDQRNWGDSSWKAYAPLAYAYKTVNKGEVKSETVTIAISGTTDAKPVAQEPVHVKIGKAVAEARVPKLVPVPAGKVPEFTEISFNHDKYKDRKEIGWSYIPTTHLPDEDVIMENLPTVTYQAKTVKTLSPDCEMKVGPIGLSNAGVKDSRANTQMAAAWTMGMVKFLSMGGVNEAAFAVGDGAPGAVLDAVRPYVGASLLGVETEPAHSHHIIAFAAENERGTGVFLMNHNIRASHVEIDGLSAKQVQVLRIAPGAADQAMDVTGGTLKFDLAPYEVVRVTVGK
ncbi:MAG TPA: hypothetical protein VFE47_11235 [Tepidisphaeraceae bacterium]|jgi:hypothetical protein|nr:hypothetical protein [Tepidisphaeraceae bacterium]